MHSDSKMFIFTNQRLYFSFKSCWCLSNIQVWWRAIRLKALSSCTVWRKMAKVCGTTEHQWSSAWNKATVWGSNMDWVPTNHLHPKPWHLTLASVSVHVDMWLSSRFCGWPSLSLKQPRKIPLSYKAVTIKHKPTLFFIDNLVEGKRRRRGNPSGTATPNRSSTNSPRTPGKRKLNSGTEDERTPTKRGRRGGGARVGMMPFV